MAAAWDIRDLEYWDARIREKVQEFGLTCYPQEFELCDHTQMLSLMAYSGMPSHYPHWSYGKSFERQKTLYDHGVSGLPYEMVINSDPCLAYLMRQNSLALQILTIAHVYGHNDFFANNFTFSHLHADLVIETFKNHANRVRGYAADPSIGQEAVELVLDAAHALSLQCRRNPAIRRRSPEEQKRAALEAAGAPPDPFQSVHKRPGYEAPELGRVPLEPEEDLLTFLRDYSPKLADWQRDLLTIVHEQTQYFLPQIETKIMNEGWACYWHRAIMNSLDLPPDLHMEFIVRHNQVVRAIPGDINPYHLGLKVWDDIVRRYDDPTPQEIEEFGRPDRTGREAIFQVRDVDRDVSFLRRFLTQKLMREMDMIEVAPEGNDLVVSRISDENDWQHVKRTLLSYIGMGSTPVIRVIDADHGGNRTLLLRHEYDGRELLLDYAEKTLRFVQQLWGRRVDLQTTLDGRNVCLSWDGQDFLQN
ncbi:SpoVR family protein [Dongia soli]|uniref:SpoVR family protein n=1 Tax=Dongia soli TaxID=600628 RepID=A0ABU5E953_9PROT|nr:SpoVR family protein [Dongia soli]MDY0882078.1 SpoVR family protein [Dongia soli]